MLTQVKKYNQRAVRKHSLRIIILVCALLMVIVGGAYVVWWLHQPTGNPTTRRQDNQGTTSPNTQAPSSGSANQSSGSGSSKSSSNSQGANPPDATIQPTAPTGQFVSNHMPDLSGKPYPNSETSTCSTTPGVLCKIQFTMGTTVKTLPGKYTDSGGNAVWSSWTLQSIGLTTGTWHITALAINGSKTAQANDPIDLQVGP